MHGQANPARAEAQALPPSALATKIPEFLQMLGAAEQEASEGEGIANSQMHAGVLGDS